MFLLIIESFDGGKGTTRFTLSIADLWFDRISSCYHCCQTTKAWINGFPNVVYFANISSIEIVRTGGNQTEGSIDGTGVRR
jgi:hypothetical protein